MKEERRGSQRHVLDLVSSGEAPATLNRLLAGTGVVLSESDRITPVSHETPEEWSLRAFCTSCAWTGVDFTRVNNWWVSEEYKGPTWDLLAECTVSGRRGLLLVEAKAHESELSRAGKTLDGTESAQSRRNHQRIAECLEETQQWFRQHDDRSCNIGVSSHYQLANRLSAAEAVASCGAPAVLLYLGFIGDTYFQHDFFRDDTHWQRAMQEYVEGVVPAGWWGTTTEHGGGGSVTMVVRSLPVRQVSVEAGDRSDQVTDPVDVIDPTVLIRIPRIFKPGMSDLALYEATRGVWRIGARREHVRYAFAVFNGTVQEVYEIRHWQPAGTDHYESRTFDPELIKGRWEFVGSVAKDAIRSRYLGKSVSHYFARGSQNPIIYAGLAK